MSIVAFPASVLARICGHITGYHDALSFLCGLVPYLRGLHQRDIEFLHETLMRKHYAITGLRADTTWRESARAAHYMRTNIRVRFVITSFYMHGRRRGERMHSSFTARCQPDGMYKFSLFCNIQTFTICAVRAFVYVGNPFGSQNLHKSSLRTSYGSGDHYQLVTQQHRSLLAPFTFEHDTLMVSVGARRDAINEPFQECRGKSWLCHPPNDDDDEMRPDAAPEGSESFTFFYGKIVRSECTDNCYYYHFRVELTRKRPKHPLNLVYYSKRAQYSDMAPCLYYHPDFSTAKHTTKKVDFIDMYRARARSKRGIQK